VLREIVESVPVRLERLFQHCILERNMFVREARDMRCRRTPTVWNSRKAF